MTLSLFAGFGLGLSLIIAIGAQNPSAWCDGRERPSW
jgi:arginine exporter protein ArgO